jgi:hypothetical protein
VTIRIDDLSEAELVDLNHKIVERLRFLQQMHAHGAMLQFSIGDRVAFDGPAGHLVTGVLVKYNKKTVTVVAGDGLELIRFRGRFPAWLSSRGWALQMTQFGLYPPLEVDG